jgi:BRCA1-associated protein
LNHISAVEGYDMKLDELQSYCVKLESQLHAAESELLDSKRYADQLAFKLKKQELKLQEIQSKSKEEFVFNEALTKNSSELNNTILAKDNTIATQQAEITDLKDQLRDLMFFLDAQSRAQNDQDLSNATVLGVNTNSTPSPIARKGKKKK